MLATRTHTHTGSMLVLEVQPRLRVAHLYFKEGAGRLEATDTGEIVLKRSAQKGEGCVCV